MEPFRHFRKFIKTKIVPFQKRAKFVNQIGKKGSKFLNKKEPFQKRVKNRQQNIVPFKKRVKNRRKKWYNFGKGSKLLNKNGTISEKGQKSSTKWYHFSQKRVIIPRKKVPLQKRVKIPQQKWYLFRKGSKILDKNGTISVRNR